MTTDWVKVKFAAECPPCEDCGEPVCTDCELHYAECGCPGPHQEDQFEYRLFEGSMYARRKRHGDA